MRRLESSSMRGSEPDGALDFDALGRVKADAGLRRRFDHALTLIGEFTLGEIRTLLRYWFTESHGPQVAEDAMQLFERYLALKQAEQKLEGVTDTAEWLARRSALRRSHFGDDAMAMFGSEEAYDAHTLARLALLRDTTLDEAQRAEAIADLEAQRDAVQRRDAALAQTPTLLAEHESQLQALGASEAQRYAERAALWGEDAAQRLAALDAQEADWARRLDAFRAARDQLLSAPGTSAAAEQATLEALLAEQFSDAEQRRVRALFGLPPPSGG